MRVVLRLALPPAAFWLVLSGHYTALLLALGAVSVAVTCLVVLRMRTAEDPPAGVRLLLRLPRYCVWLEAQILRSAFDVLRQVWSPRLAPRPAVAVTGVDDLGMVGQVIYANSITLTPGTLSLSANDEGIEVHALRASDLTDLHAGTMRRRVQVLEGR